MYDLLGFLLSRQRRDQNHYLDAYGIDDFDVSVEMVFRILDKMGVGEYVFLGI